MGIERSAEVVYGGKIPYLARIWDLGLGNQISKPSALWNLVVWETKYNVFFYHGKSVLWHLTMLDLGIGKNRRLYHAMVIGN